MKYFIKGDGEKFYAEIMTEKQLAESGEEANARFLDIQDKERVRHCKADIFENSIQGSICTPSRGAGEIVGRFYVDAERLLIISDSAAAKNIMDSLFSQGAIDMNTPAQVLFAFVDSMIKEEGDYIDDLEEALNNSESSLLEEENSIPDGFEHYMHDIRKNLLNTGRYYEQLGDMIQILADSPIEVVDERSGRLFRFLAGRMDRLSADAHNLREYSAQLYDMYQSQINVRQNKVIQFLTVITTIFMPLTLITGWYGMNFKNMPELVWKYGYIGVACFSALLLIAEYRIFKKKKWM